MRSAEVRSTEGFDALVDLGALGDALAGAFEGGLGEALESAV